MHCCMESGCVLQRMCRIHGMIGMVWYGMVWYGMVWYGMVWCGMVRYGVVQYGIGMVWLIWSGV